MSDFSKQDIEKIRESLESFEKKAPEFVWKNLDRQLFIDRIWLTLKTRLDKIERFRRWKNAAAYFFSILLFCIAGTYLFFLNNGEKEIAAFSFYHPAFNVPILRISSNSTFRIPSSDNKSEEILIEKRITQKRAFYKQNIKTEEKKFFINKNISNIDNSIEEKFRGTVVDTCITHIESLKMKSLDLKRNELTLLSLICRSDTFDKKTIKRKMQYEVGVITCMMNTRMINNEFKSGQNSESLTKINPAIVMNFGLVYNYNFQSGNSLNTELVLFSRQKQNVNYYKSGELFEKSFLMRYAKGAIAYQWNFPITKKNVYSKIAIRSGMYFSYLTKSEVRVHSRTTSTENKTEDYRKNDFGLKAGLGHEFFVNRFILGYGLQAEYGLENIFKGNSIVPASFDLTRNFNHGVYFMIKYSL